MNREIKFRGKLVNSEEWTEGNLCIRVDGNYIITPDETVLGKYGKVDKETVGQYTGLHDKNGKEIWENDIVEITREGIYETIYEKGIIIFKNGCFFIKSKKTLLALYNCELNNYKVKVIGNITDNSELLGGK